MMIEQAVTARNPQTRAERALHELARRAGQRTLLGFMRYCWWEPHELKVGIHTRAITERLTKAVQDWRKGKSTFLKIEVPFRHGKSDIVSRALPAWFLGSCADLQPSIIMSGYGADLVGDFSRATKRIIQSGDYKRLFPDVEVARGADRIDKWAVVGSSGNVTAVGLGGVLSGRGGHLIICDDYCKNREEAISTAYRNATWDAFRNNLLTRQNAPASIVVVCATPWHIDDVSGRIDKLMQEDKDFFQFETLRFPARVEGKYDYLFQELHTPEWYDAQRASLGVQANALLDCNPIAEGGNRFDVSKIKLHYNLDNWTKAREARCWDVASSSRQRDKDNPDYTAGIMGAITTSDAGHGLKKYELWIRSIEACRAEAPERNSLIRATAQADGRGVIQYVEAFGGYKDAYTTLKAQLSGVSIVEKCNPTGDKSAKLADLEPIFDAGNVNIYVPGCEKWLDTWTTQFMQFPDGAHDDFCDATALLYHSQIKKETSAFLF